VWVLGGWRALRPHVSSCRQKQGACIVQAQASLAVLHGVCVCVCVCVCVLLAALSCEELPCLSCQVFPSHSEDTRLLPCLCLLC
jgi:hypothetical protein